ncbi:MAG: hypothetical protein ACYS18_12960, partial [Planctomycetota bacterium]
QNQPKSTTSVQPQARILESRPDFAVIEITCSCGKKTNLRCEYAPDQSSDEAGAPKMQNSVPEADANSQNAVNAVPASDQVTEQTK